MSNRFRRGDVLGLLAIVGVALVYLAPALKDGLTFAPMDLGSHLTGLTAGVYPSIHNHLDGDIVTQAVPWDTLDWKAVHAGQFPMWNQYEVLGMPQFLNFESSVLSLPDLVGYLFPLQAAFLVNVLVKLLIAGTGTYLFGRVVGMRPAAAVFAAATYMLSGPFTAWLGWAMTDVFAWAGFIAAFAVLAYRRPGRMRYVALLAVAVAFSVYGGFPEANVILGTGLAFLFVAGVAVRFVGGMRPDWRGAAGVLAGLGLGVGLAAPLWLPGLQVVRSGARLQEVQAGAIGLHFLVLDLFPFWDGAPLGSTSAPQYYVHVGYVGITAAVFAVTGLVVHRKRPLAIGLAAAAAACAVAVYGVFGLDPAHALEVLIGAGSVELSRATVVLAFLVAVLAGLGVDATSSAVTDLAAAESLLGRRALLVVSVAMAVFVAVSALYGSLQHLSPTTHSIRMSSLLWPCVTASGMLAVGVLFYRWQPARPVATAILGGTLAAQLAFLAGTGGALNSYADRFYPATAASSAFAADVGGALVGLDG
ncbi:MAG TPA: hypothetical protein VGS21_03850, partial [Acidimicrobiales bacterium]|nr:hypothetical protein [Acidimicrobiales bacterium]